jgi:TolB-like protein/DNA-binding winged helix-turn-helix (wHTH) protein
MENGVSTGWIVFDAVEIDCAGRRLFVTGSEMPLEPKAFAVLHLLASQPGKAFTRDDILDAVWGHRHVTPAVLNRIVTLLRHALGESAEEHRYLHTLHGVGYRLDADVRVGATRTELASGAARREAVNVVAPDAGASIAASIGVASTTSAASVLAPHQAAADLPTAVTPALSPVPLDSNWHPRSAWLVLLGVLMVSVLVAALYWMRRPMPSAAAAPTLVVLPLRAIGNAQDEHTLADGLSEELVTRLSRIEGLRLISSTSASIAQSSQFDLNQLGDKLKVTHALEGSLRHAGDQLRIDLRLIDVPGGATLWAQNYDRKLVDVLSIEQEIAQAVAAALALKFGIEDKRAAVDPDVFREYLEIHRAEPDTLDLPEREQVIVRARALIAREPTFARAHGLLARMQAIGQRTPAEREEARREAARARELDPDETDALVAHATLACLAVDWQGCARGFERALALNPTDSVFRGAHAV